MQVCLHSNVPVCHMLEHEEAQLVILQKHEPQSIYS